VTVHVIATGGTIASHFDGTDWTEIPGQQLVDELGALPCAVEVHDVASGPSSNLSTDDMVAIAERVRVLLDAGARGVVVVHGTDTMELTAFVAQLLLGTSPTRRPVVFTGSMRVHSHAAPDGPTNLRDAIAVAGSDAGVGREVLVCLNGELHAADRVTKRSAASVDAFHSAPFEPVGSVTDGRVEFAGEAPPRRAAAGLRGEVPLVSCWPGMPPAVLEAALRGLDGEHVGAVVVEVFGDLNGARNLWGPVHAAAKAGTLVVLASRAFTPTSTNEGLELLGAVGAGGLTAQKARLAAMAALATTDREDATAFLHQYVLHHDAGERSTR
jgi:L-asparaginase